jgi:hypothetical protein
MKTAKVVSVTGDGTWKEFYKFEVELDNGDSGVMYKKTQQHWLEINQEINYSINDKGTLKVIREGWNNNPSSNGASQDRFYSKEEKSKIFDAKDRRISKLSVLKCAVDIAISKGVYTPDEILGQAEQFLGWIYEEDNGSENNDSDNNAPF